MSVLLQCFINTGRFQLGAQQRCQQVGNHNGKYGIDAAGKHLGNSGNECRRKTLPPRHSTTMLLPI